MTSLEVVRHLCQDPPLFASDDIPVGGEGQVDQGTYQLKYFPIVAGTVVIKDSDGDIVSSAGYTVDNEAGTVTFTTPPEAELYKFNYKHTLLSDAAITAFLDLEGNVKLAAAQALLSIAASQALILKKIKTLDLQTDGPAIATALKDLAKEYRKQVQEDDSAWDIAEQVYDQFGFEEKILKDTMRES